MADQVVPKVVRTLEDCLLLLEGLLSSLGLELSPEGTFEQRVEHVWAFLSETLPSDHLIIRPPNRPIERLYA
jgi:hypothetical protein